jgi:transcriptional regulator with XRE-family HTH domain
MGAAPNTYPAGAETLPRSLFGKPSRNAYRAAIKKVILDVQARNGLSDLELADLVGCHKETIENARAEENSLDVLTLLNIAYAFGEDAIAPVRALYLCAPVGERDKDELIRRAMKLLSEAEAME